MTFVAATGGSGGVESFAVVPDERDDRPVPALQD